jgi:GNAT superfamily N-acetyltransferase
VGILAVSAGAEGRGAGGALLRAADAWSRERGFAFVTLNVFHKNFHARDVYAHAGDAPEVVRYWKPIE